MTADKRAQEDVGDVATPELIKRAEAGDRDAALELDRREVEPEIVPPGPPPIQTRPTESCASHEQIQRDRLASETEDGLAYVDVAVPDSEFVFAPSPESECSATNGSPS